ncbi:3-methyladenine dna glycosylase [Gossypium arboreum]|uniref:3-methyladenine dna glycosylase n=1 Tax=Gossypium arboreum TaxID=29729 RepID=A0A0B0PQ07_GOSAR|nr:3-methyladenine dna glycosylase [Gossypium arboreum]
MLVGMVHNGWQFGFANSLFLSTRAETGACVSVVYDTRLCYTVVCALGYPTILKSIYPTDLTQPRHMGVSIGRV